MPIPPFLTPRQSQIVPLLIKGWTRKEIAHDLGISEEMVRQHIRKILEKFEAANVRDCLSDLVYYEETYGNSGANHKFFIEHLHICITIADCGNVAWYEKASQLIVVGPSLEEITECVICDGEIIETVIDGRRHDVSRVTHGQNWYEQILDEPLYQGCKYERNLKCKLLHAFESKSEYWGQEQVFPTEDFTLEIKLPQSRPAKRFWAEYSLQNNFTEIQLSHICPKKTLARLSVKNPKLGSWYKIFWDW